MALTNGEIITILGYELPDKTSFGGLVNLNYIDNLPKNEVFPQLINKVGTTYFNSLNFETKFSRFRISKMEYASIIEDIYVNYNGGKPWNRDLKDQDEKFLATVKVTYQDFNTTLYYPLTIERSRIEKAFRSENGFEELLNNMWNALYSKIQIDEHNLSINTLSLKDTYTANQQIVVTDPRTDEASAQNFLKTVSQYSFLFSEPSNAYNSIATDTSVNSSDCVLVIRNDVLDAIDFNYLKSIYNLDKVNAFKNISIIPISSFGKPETAGDTKLVEDDTIWGVLMDKSAFYICDTYTATLSHENAIGRYYNYFYHKDGRYGFRLGKNRVMFTSANAKSVPPVQTKSNLVK